MVTAGGAASPAAMATPMNGAVQGVATTHRQQAGEEAADMAGACRQALPGPHQAGADLEHAGQVQPDREQQPGHGGDEHRRLELEAPARRRAGRPRRQQRRAERRERHQHARRCRRPRASVPCRARRRPEPTTFIASTGNTQGIRLRISPPRNASPSMRCRPRRAGCGGTAPARACSSTSVSRPLRSRTDSTPDSSSVARNALPGFSASVKPPCRTVSGCAALSRMHAGLRRE